MNTTDSLNLMKTNPVVPDNVKVHGASQAQKERFAKDFESVFLEKLLDEMKSTIGNWGFEHDGPAKQIQGLFWTNLARDISNHGGLGMWKDIYRSLNDIENNKESAGTLDNQL